MSDVEEATITLIQMLKSAGEFYVKPLPGLPVGVFIVQVSPPVADRLKQFIKEADRVPDPANNN